MRPSAPQNGDLVEEAVEQTLVAGEKVDNLKIEELSGDLGGLATLTMPEKISITNFSASTPSANGKIALNGTIAKLMEMLSVVQDADPMPYAGDYAIAQNVATDSAGAITLSGDATINKFAVLSNGKPSFTEDKIVVRLWAITPERMRRSAPIRAIVCPRVVGSGRSRLVRASPGDALRALAPTTVFLVQHEQAAAVASIRHLVSLVPTFVLELGADLDGVPELVRSAIEGGA